MPAASGRCGWPGSSGAGSAWTRSFSGTYRPPNTPAVPRTSWLSRSSIVCAPPVVNSPWRSTGASTGLEDLLGVADAEVTKDRLYRTLDGLRVAQEAIENDLQKQLQTLFDLDYDLLLYDLTSTY